MKKIILIVALGGFIFFSCDKSNPLPAYNADIIFSANSKLTHNKDTVNLGDTVLLTVGGQIADTTNTVSGTVKISIGSANGSSVGTLFIGSLSKTISQPTSPSTLYNWSSKIAVPVPNVSRKTSLFISTSFDISPLSFSSQIGNQSSVDSKNIYVK